MKFVLASLILTFATAAWAECVVPTSSWISLLCYNGSTVTATMSGREYTFCGISRSTFDDWSTASSAGTYYNDSIKGRYSCL